MPVCKVCGAPVSENDNVCPYCGSDLPKVIKTTQVPNDNKVEELPSISSGNENEKKLGSFCDVNWKQLINKKGKTGIILGDTRRLTDKDQFYDAVKRFIEARFKDVKYDFLDLGTEKVCGNIEPTIENLLMLLEKIYDVSVPKYLLIIGDWSVIPAIKWRDEADHEGGVVPSDLPYITFNTASPWSGKKFDFKDAVMIGRIPTTVMTNFKEAITYLDNAGKFKPTNIINGFAYSAHEWKLTSANVFFGLTEMLNISPKMVCKPIEGFPDGTILQKLNGYNLLGFNLHGASWSHYWYGQYGNFMPEAFMASLLPDGKEGYMMCTEACYGARPTVDAKNVDSIVVQALTHNCMAFVGSSVTAYGQAYGQMVCADVIANVFLKSVREGLTAGESFNLALSALCKKRMSETEIKTLAEFALYGDPSIALYKDNAIQKVAFNDYQAKICRPLDDETLARKLVPFNEQVGFYGRTGDDYVAVSFDPQANHEIKQVAHMISKKSKDFITSKFSELKDETPIMYKVFGMDEYRSNYVKKNENGILETISLHLDKEGNVIEVYFSK